MNGKQILAAIAGVGVVSAGAAAQEAVQWRVEDGGNGHWYSIVDLGQSSTSIEQCTALIASIGALPCVFDNAEEWIWWTENHVVRPFSDGSAHQGLYRSPNQQWKTFDGQVPPFTAWTTGLPNNPANNYVIAVAVPAGGCFGNPAPCWEDYIAADTQFRVWTVEWSADCNNDGIVDYGQILDGSLEDLDANGVPDCCDAGASCTPCAADLDGNGEVNGIDLAIILGKWGTNGGKDYPNADLDRDGTIGGADLAQILGAWGACP